MGSRAYYSNYMQGSNKHISLLNCLIVYYLGYLLLETPLKQLQLMVFGKIIISDAIIAVTTILIIIFVLVLECLLSRKIRKRYSLVLIFALFSAAECIYYIIFNNVGIYLAAIFLYRKVTPLLLVFIILLYRRYLNLNVFFRLVNLFAFSNAIMTLVQFVNNDLIWEFTSDNEGNQLFWSILSMDFSRLRPPGLMNSALSSGYVSLIWLCLLIMRYLKGKLTKRKYVFCLVISTLAIVATQTRNIYFSAIFIIVYFGACFIFQPRITKWMPFFSVIASVVYLIFFLIIAPISSTNVGVLSSASSLIRLRNWEVLFSYLQQENIGQLLFGIMKWQEVAADTVFSDSLYFDLIFSMGIVGLFLYIGINFRLQRSLCSKSENIPIAALVGSILFIGVANIPSACFESTILVIAALLIYQDALEKG